MNFLKLFFLLFLSLFFLQGISQNSPVDSKVNSFSWEYDSPENQGFSTEKINALIKIQAELGTKKLLIIRNDKIICEWFAPGFHDSIRTHYTASLAKAVVSGLSLALAMDDGLVSADEPVCNFIPEWRNNDKKSKITIRQLATHTSGIEDAEVSETEQKEMTKKGLNPHKDLPGWKGSFWRQDNNPFVLARDSAPVLFTPGTNFAYSNPGIGLLNYSVTSSLKNSSYKNIKTYLKERIFDPIGINENEYSIGYNKVFDTNGLQIVPGWGGGGFTANGVARIGRLMLNKGNWEGKQIIDSAIVEQVLRYNGIELPELQSSGTNNWATKGGGFAPTLGWYCNHDGVWEYLPRDAFGGAGAGNQMLMVIPCLNLIIVRFGNTFLKDVTDKTFFLGAEKFLFNPIMEAFIETPYPKSGFIKSVRFEPADSITRLAKGSDNWPITWADDGNLYSAYGDGWGFESKTDIKLSLGLGKVQGNPPNLKGENIRSTSGERVGQGKFGPKASGMLMVDGVLYMLVRNTKNAQLAWSEDYGKTWEWADWRFEESFGCPTFLNYGRNYEDAPDPYVYIYSQNDETAYKNCDEMVLARVSKNQINNRDAYTFFAGLYSEKPVWTEDINKRQAVFGNPGKCYRSGITYNKGLKKYLWCQIIPVSSGKELQGPRYKGGLGIFESDNPWGPWKTVYYTNDWDIGPGESGSIPTKWMSKDGKTAYYLFSGDDCFSVRKLKFITN